MPFYAKNQLVWAKIKGYPWWPAIVAKSNQTRSGAIEDEVLVNFIGENSHAVVAMEKIADFEESFEEHGSSKNKRLAESIKTAQRILEGVSTYEEEKERLLKKPSKQASEPRTPEKEKPAKPGKKKENEPKESPRVNKVVHKSKEKETNHDKKLDNLLEFVPHRFTRSRSKQENVEMLTEPLIYNSRKNQKSPGKRTKRRLLRSSRRGNKNEEDEEDEDEEDNEEEEQEEGEEEDGEDEEEEEGDIIEKVEVTKKVKKSNAGVKIAATSKVTIKRETKGRKRTGKKGKMGKLKVDEEEESRKSDSDTPVSLIKENRLQEEIDHDLELEKMLEDVDENEDGESFDFNLDGNEEGEMKQDGGVRNEKRSAFGNDREFPSPNYLSQANAREFGQDERECIIKKVKPNGSGEESKDGMYANSSTNSTKIVMAYNSLKIRKFENDLEQILNKMAKKFFGKEKLKEDDPELLQLLNVLQEFENNTFNGAEFISSDLGKLFKTVHFVFTKHKDLLCKTADGLIATLAKVLHKIKNKIIQFCLDNTDYIESLNLPEDEQEVIRHPSSISAINVDENRTKVEEPNTEMTRHLSSHSHISTKMEEERQRVPGKKDEMAASSHVEPGKRTEGVPVVSNFALRKKICQKFAALLQRVYSMEKDKSQELTLQIEEKINNFYQDNINRYKEAIKRLLKIIKANKLEVEELVQIQDLKIGDFSNMLKQKLDTIVNFVESPDASVSTAPEKKSEANSQLTGGKKNGKDSEITRKSNRISKKDGPADSNMVVPKLEDMNGQNIKEEADKPEKPDRPDRASYQMIKISTQTSYQQKIEYS